MNRRWRCVRWCLSAPVALLLVVLYGALDPVSWDDAVARARPGSVQEMASRETGPGDHAVSIRPAKPTPPPIQWPPKKPPVDGQDAVPAPTPTPTPTPARHYRVLFSSCFYPNSVYDVGVMNPDGGGWMQLTYWHEFPSCDNCREWNPHWSPDLQHILFECDLPTADRPQLVLCVANDDGSGQTRFTDFPAGHGTWSPDGTRIAFDTGFDGDLEIAVVPASLARAPWSLQDKDIWRIAAGECPSWSPDGQRIAYYHTPDGGAWTLRTVKPDGTDVTVVVDMGTNSPGYGCPTWSPDSQHIVWPWNDKPGNMSNLYRVRVDGKELTNLTPADDTIAPFNDWEPSWSPDGKTIIFAALGGIGGGDYSLYRMNPDGSQLQQITYPEPPFKACMVRMPDWSPR